MKPSKFDKRKLILKALSELVDVRKVLSREYISYKIAEVGMEDALPVPDLPKPKSVKPDPFQDMENLYTFILNKVKSKEELYAAMGYWSAGNLMEFTVEQRAAICRALVDASKAIGHKPLGLWPHVLKNPSFLEDWADEVLGEIDDSTSILTEARL